MRLRLDLELVSRGLAKSRNQAQTLIKDGKVLLNGTIVTKSNTDVASNDKIELTERIKYVSRGGLKLEKALAHFKINVKNKIAVDIGSSTGGFTDCLLQNGAKKVFAIDVGTEQLDISLRNNKKVIVMEQTDIRKAKIDDLADIAVIDTSFISLEYILPEAIRLTKNKADIIALIKPQFEVGPEHINRKNGVVKGDDAREQAIQKVRRAGETLGLRASPVIESPIHGGDGNIEYLIWFSK